VGIVLGFLGPGVAFEMAPVAAYLLFFLLAVTMIDIKLNYSLIPKLSFDIISLSAISFFLVPILTYYFCVFFGLSERITAAFVVSSLAPYAIVAPLFIEKLKIDGGTSILLIILSMIICPFVIPWLLPMIGGASLVIHTKPLFLFLIIISIGPLLFATFFQKINPTLVKKVAVYKHFIASGLLALLIYALFGSAIHTWHRHANLENWLLVLGFHLVLDFGLFFILVICFKKFFSANLNLTYSLTLSMRNMAIPASLLLAYDPEFAFVPAFGFIIHAFYFNFLGILSREKLDSVFGFKKDLV
jgi:predicted Na+-dependent transporter